MTLPEYLEKPGAKSLKKLSEDSGVSYQTLKKLGKGGKLATYAKALAVSKATGSVVSVHALCG